MNFMKSKYVSGVSLIFFLLFSFVITSCVEEGDDDVCEVTVISSEGGSVKVSDKDVMSGDKVTLEATPEEGYEFVSWTIDGVVVSEENPCLLVITANSKIVANFKKKEYSNTLDYDYVDMGLSVKWATCNVGADSPEEYGYYFAWGEIVPKNSYTIENYKWCEGNFKSFTKYCIQEHSGTVDNKTTLEPEDDVAHIYWGGSWRMPTIFEVLELLENCTKEWVSKNGVEGALFRSNINGNSIFMPATGFCEGDKRFNDGSIGCYYSSSLYALPATYKYTSRAYYIYFNEFDVPKWYSDYGYRYYGRAVRPVSP